MPESVHLTYDASYAEFRCAVTGDDSTPVTVGWYRVGSRTPITSKTGRVNVTVSEDGTVLSFMVQANDTEGWARLTGNYQLKATNGYSTQVANFSLTIDPPPVLPPDETTPGGNHMPSHLTFSHFFQDCHVKDFVSRGFRFIYSKHDSD